MKTFQFCSIVGFILISPRMYDWLAVLLGCGYMLVSFIAAIRDR